MNWLPSVFVDMWPGWVGGAVISAVVVTLLLVRNRQLGVSFCYGFAIDRVNDWVEYRTKTPSPAADFPLPTMPLPAEADGAAMQAALGTDEPLPDNPADFPMPGAFPLPTMSGPALINESSWPTVFLFGILMGGIASGILARAIGGTAWIPSFDYAGFDSLWKLGPVAKTAVLFGGGILVGFGTRMAGGCTSGHAIMGAPALQKASILAMCVFMGTGIATTFLLNTLL